MLINLCIILTYNLDYLTCHILISNADTHTCFQRAPEIQVKFIIAFQLEQSLRLVFLEALTRTTFSLHYQCSSVLPWLEQLPLALVSYLHSSIFI